MPSIHCEVYHLLIPLAAWILLNVVPTLVGSTLIVYAEVRNLPEVTSVMARRVKAIDFKIITPDVFSILNSR